MQRKTILFDDHYDCTEKQKWLKFMNFHLGSSWSNLPRWPLESCLVWKHIWCELYFIDSRSAFAGVIMPLFIVVNKSPTSNLSVVLWVIWPHSLGKNVFEKARICISAVIWSNNWGFCSQESFINLSTTSGKYLCNSWCVGRSWALSCILGSSASRTAANPAGHLLCNSVPPLHLHT